MDDRAPALDRRLRDLDEQLDRLRGAYERAKAMQASPAYREALEDGWARLGDLLMSFTPSGEAALYLIGRIRQLWEHVQTPIETIRSYERLRAQRDALRRA